MASHCSLPPSPSAVQPARMRVVPLVDPSSLARLPSFRTPADPAPFSSIPVADSAVDTREGEGQLTYPRSVCTLCESSERTPINMSIIISVVGVNGTT